MGKKRKKIDPKGRKNPQVFDRLGKLIYQEMSGLAIRNSLSGMFEIELSSETPVVFGATESIRDRGGKLEKRESDFMLLAGAREFALEFQSSDDPAMGGRMFRYGYAQSERRKPDISGNGEETVYHFPAGAVIYLEPTKNTPDVLRIGVRHNEAVIPVYSAKVYKLLEYTLEEIAADRQYPLLPFYVMKHRREINAGNISAERLSVLARETQAAADEIESVLERGVAKGVITERDKVILLEKTLFLYEELYGGIAEFKEGMMCFEEKFKSKIPEREAELIRQTAQRTAQEERAKIFSLWKQGYTPEEAERMLAREGGSGGLQPATP